MKLLRSILSPTNGTASSMRLIFVYSSLVIVTVWAVISSIKCAIQDVPTGVLALITCFSVSKLVQNTQEDKAVAKTAPPAP